MSNSKFDRLKALYGVIIPDQIKDAKQLSYNDLIAKYKHMNNMAIRLCVVPEVAKLWSDWANILNLEILSRLTISHNLPKKLSIPTSLPNEPVRNTRCK